MSVEKITFHESKEIARWYLGYGKLTSFVLASFFYVGGKNEERLLKKNPQVQSLDEPLSTSQESSANLNVSHSELDSQNTPEIE